MAVDHSGIRALLTERQKLAKKITDLDAKRRSLDRERQQAQQRLQQIDAAFASLEALLAGSGTTSVVPQRTVASAVPTSPSELRARAAQLLPGGQRAKVLEALRECGTAKAGDIALATGIAHASVTAVLSVLVADGLVVRPEQGTYRAVPVRDDAEREKLPPATPEDDDDDPGDTVEDDVRAWLAKNPAIEFTAAGLTETLGRTVTGGMLGILRDREGIVTALGAGRWRARSPLPIETT